METVLVVEDEARIRDIVRDYFSAHGMTCDLARDGAEALDLLRDHDYDAILLDILMPHLDGFQVCAAVRRDSPVPILFLTALGGEEDVLRGYALGCDEYHSPLPLSIAACPAALQGEAASWRTGRVFSASLQGCHPFSEARPGKSMEKFSEFFQKRLSKEAAMRYTVANTREPCPHCLPIRRRRHEDCTMLTIGKEGSLWYERKQIPQRRKHLQRKPVPRLRRKKLLQRSPRL